MLRYLAVIPIAFTLVLAIPLGAQEPEGEQPVRVLSDETASATAMAFSADGQSLFIATADGNITAIGVAEFEPHPPRTITTVPDVDHLTVSPVAEMIAVHTQGGEVLLVDTKGEAEPRHPRPIANDVAGPLALMHFSSDGSELVIVNDRERCTWVIADGKAAGTPLAGLAGVQPPRFFPTPAGTLRWATRSAICSVATLFLVR
jgi:hypothetical protein